MSSMQLLFFRLLKDAVKDVDYSNAWGSPMPSLIDIVPRSLKKMQVYIIRKWAFSLDFTTNCIIITDSFTKKDRVGKFGPFPTTNFMWNDAISIPKSFKMSIQDGILFNIHGISCFMSSFTNHLKLWSVFQFLETSLLKCQSEATFVI